MKAIGIDIGTTSVCGVVLDVESGSVIRSLTKVSDAFIKGCAVWEKIQSVDKIINTAYEILNEFYDEDISVIGVTGQMHGILYLDSEGNCVSPLYTWQDGRGNLPYKDTTYAKYLDSYAGYGNVTDFYNRVNGIRPDNAVSYATIHDYLVMKLCGLKNPVIHSTDAASFGCYDIGNNKFDYDFSGEIINDYHIAGKYKGIPVSVAVGDNQASVFSTLDNSKNVLLNIGTGSQVSVISDKIISCDDIEVRPYFENKFLLVGAALCGGRAYSLLKNFYSEIIGYAEEICDDKVYEIMDKMLSKSETLSIKVDTRFAGTRKNTEICGSITGLTTENFNPSQLTLGVLDGMAEELYKMYEKMGNECFEIIGSGNGIRKNPALVKAFERKFNKEMKIPVHLEEAAFGAALFGLVSCGIFKNMGDAQKIIKYKPV